MKQTLLLLLTLLSMHAFSQTFTGPGGPITDDGLDNYYYLTVSGVTPAVMDTAFGLETVCINLTHTWDDDLTISLIAPDGTEFELTSHCGGDGDNYTNTCFNYDATTPIYQGSAPFTGTFLPKGIMSLLNNGQDPNGLWTLHILDTWAWADVGTLLDWSVTFGDNPAVPFPFSAANLPLMVINTGGKIIPDAYKIEASMKLIDNGPGIPNHVNDPATDYFGEIGIEIRGESSTSYPKKSYSMETRLADSSNNDVSLLGLPVDNDWILYASFSDKTLLRNFYTFRLFNKMGHWASHWKFCEVMLDGEYQGIYLLGEKIKKGVDRVNIHNMTTNDTTGQAVTGGYIFKLDWEDVGDVGWLSEFPAVGNTSNLKYLFVYPKAEKVQPAQIAYLKAYADSFEFAMNSPSWADTLLGYRQFISEPSFIDMIILNEFTKNLDAYRLSTFFHKDRSGKINAGPPWDYDLAWGNGDFMEAYLVTGWNYPVQVNYTNQCPFWWQKFFQDSLFMNKLRCRWEELRQDVFDPSHIKAELDSLVGVLSVSTDLNFTKWPILGQYVWPNPAPIPTTYAGEIDKMKDWVDLRINWLDNHWTGTCRVTGFEHQPKLPDGQTFIYPNPNRGSFQLVNTGLNPEGKVEILDVMGKTIYIGMITDSREQVSIDAGPGLYFLRITNNSNVSILKFIIQE
ncbi:MAG: CotH kinase family protein [Bacteroidetes bacterium]|nr:CotH kinase family protein [Bacteroidota bacterium]